MKFISKTEAYTYCIYVLTQLEETITRQLKDYPSEQQGFVLEAMVQPMARAIENIKRAMENHEQNPWVITEHLEKIKSIPNVDMQRIFTTLQKAIAHSNFNQTPQEKFENVLGRRVESEWAISLLLNPTQAMMKAVGEVSAKIVKSIRENESFIQEKVFCHVFTEDYSILGFGGFKSEPILTDIIQLLENNDPIKFIEIMCAHHTFGRYMLPGVVICNPPIRKPVGQLHELIQSFFKGNPEDFFTKVSERPTGKHLRAMFMKELTYRKSPLFKQATNRGRNGSIQKIKTQRLGLMLVSQEAHERDLPTHDNFWVADCKGQLPLLDSQYVIDLIENDTVYVAGPSGMTTTCLGQMELQLMEMI
jgi:hypothetical protein